MTTVTANVKILKAIDSDDFRMTYRLTRYAEQESAYSAQDRDVWAALARMGREALGGMKERGLECPVW